MISVGVLLWLICSSLAWCIIRRFYKHERSQWIARWGTDDGVYQWDSETQRRFWHVWLTGPIGLLSAALVYGSLRKIR